MDETTVTNKPANNDSAISQLNRLVVLLAIAVLIATVVSFFVVALTLHQVIWRAMLLGVMSNIIANAAIYLTLYFSLARVAEYRQENARRQLISELKEAISPGQSVAVQVVETIPGKVDTKYIAHNYLSPEKRDLLQRFLLAIYRLVVALTQNQDIRLYCHIADLEKFQLHPVSVASGHMNDDYRVPVPFDGPGSEPFIIGKAMKAGRIIAENLPPNHLDTYPLYLRAKILANLKCVIATPILTYDPGDEDTAIPIGTVSIDCTSATLEQLGMVDSRGVVTDEINDILKSCASVVHRVLASGELTQ
jgi:hypothetical protein